MFFNNSIIVVLIGACIQVKLCSRAARRPINNIISLETCKLMEYHDCCVLIVFIYASMVCWQQGGHIHLKWKCQKIFQNLGSTFVTSIIRFASRVHCFSIYISWEYIRIMLDSVYVLIKACFPSIWHYCSTFGIGHIIGTCVHSIKKEWRYYCARMYTFVYLKYMLCNGF